MDARVKRREGKQEVVGVFHEKQRERGKLPIGRAQKTRQRGATDQTIRTGSMPRIDGRVGNDEVREKGMESRT